MLAAALALGKALGPGATIAAAMTPWRPHLLPVRCTPPVVVAAWRRRGPVVALETGVPSAAHGTQTLVAGVPLARWQVERGAIECRRLRAAPDFPSAEALAAAPTPFHALERCVAALACGESLAADAPPLGAYGYFGYECLAPPSLARLAPFVDGAFVLTDVVVRWREAGGAPELWARDDALASELMAELVAEPPVSEPPEPSRAHAAQREPFVEGDLSLADYSRSFAQARCALAAGDSYQLCFTYPLRRELAGDPFALWLRLRRDHKAPFSAYFEDGAVTLVSCSPERFVRVERGGRIEARPMKGTAAKPAGAVARAAATLELANSQKALAENLMIADLLRNDLGRVAALGSVRAAQPALVEEHATLLQMVSVLEAELADGKSVADLLAAAFPPGSMTGAPKVRAIEQLRLLEAEPRGPYSGILGYLAVDGRCDWSVVIRTALCAHGKARVQVGGGLVWDSQPDEEWAESRAKAEPLLRALAAAADTGTDPASTRAAP